MLQAKGALQSEALPSAQAPDVAHKGADAWRKASLVSGSFDNRMYLTYSKFRPTWQLRKAEQRHLAQLIQHEPEPGLVRLVR